MLVHIVRHYEEVIFAFLLTVIHVNEFFFAFLFIVVAFFIYIAVNSIVPLQKVAGFFFGGLVSLLLEKKFVWIRFVKVSSHQYFPSGQ